MNAEQIRKNLAAKVAAAKGLASAYNDSAMPTEVSDRLTAMLGEIDTMKASLQVAERLESNDDFMAQPAVAPVSFRNTAPTEGAEVVDYQSWRSFKLATPMGEKEFRYFVPERVTSKDYKSAFEAYLRKGYNRMGPNDVKTLSEGVDTAGGFLVEEDYHAELIKKIATNAVIRQLARVVTTGSNSVEYPRINYTTDNKYTSGVRLTWTGEQPATATSARVTDPVFGNITVPINTAMASMPLTNDLVEDSQFDIVGMSQMLLAEAFALGEDNIFINGTGAGQPMGILGEVDANGPATTKTGTNAVLTTSGDAHSGKRLHDCYYAVPAQYRKSGVWVMPSDVLQQADDLVDGNKRPILQTLNTGSFASAAEPVMIKNRPVYVDEFVPAAGNSSNSVIFGDWSGYYIFDRVGLSVQRLTEIYAETNLQLLLARRRVGGYCMEPWRFRILQLGA